MEMDTGKFINVQDSRMCNRYVSGTKNSLGTSQIAKLTFCYFCIVQAFLMDLLVA